MTWRPKRIEEFYPNQMRNQRVGGAGAATLHCQHSRPTDVNTKPRVCKTAICKSSTKKFAGLFRKKPNKIIGILN